MAKKLNVLWISFEDCLPLYGCYGDKIARTPAVDRLASEGCIYPNAFSTAPICAPARAAVITGMYPTSIGAQHMRTTRGQAYDAAGPALRQVPWRVLPQRRLLLFQQRQDGLPVRTAVCRLGRLFEQGALEKPPGFVDTILRCLQPRIYPRVGNVGGAARVAIQLHPATPHGNHRSGFRRGAAVLSGYAPGSKEYRQELRQHGPMRPGHGRVARPA